MQRELVCQSENSRHGDELDDTTISKSSTTPGRTEDQRTHWKRTAKFKARYKVTMITTGSLTAMTNGVKTVVCAISASVTPLSAFASWMLWPRRRARDLKISRGYVSGTPIPKRYAAKVIIKVMN